MQTLLQGITQEKNDNTKMIGANLFLVFNKRNKHLIILKNRDIIIRKVDLSDKAAKKIFIVDGVQYKKVTPIKQPTASLGSCCYQTYFLLLPTLSGKHF